jgi:Raf kinase inhibitor-like YbhB/YbcL family protein
MLDNADFQVVSPVFRNGHAIPSQYTCKGHNVNPPLNILNVPPQAQSLALIMHDPDGISGDYLHWLMWDIPPVTESISVNDVPVGAIQGANGSGKAGYMGPCPPKGSGAHRYKFHFYALDSPMNLASGAGRKELEAAMKGHIIDQYTLVGTFSADS